MHYPAQKESQYLGAVLYSPRLFCVDEEAPLPLLLENKKIAALRKEAANYFSNHQLARFINIDRLSECVRH